MAYPTGRYSVTGAMTKRLGQPAIRYVIVSVTQEIMSVHHYSALHDANGCTSFYCSQGTMSSHAQLKTHAVTKDTERHEHNGAKGRGTTTQLSIRTPHEQSACLLRTVCESPDTSTREESTHAEQASCMTVKAPRIRSSTDRQNSLLEPS